MKTIEVKSNFKQVKSDSKSVHAGQKRESLTWSFEGWEAQDVAVLSEQDKALVAKVLNDALEQFGKAQLLRNSDDWDYVPADITVDEYVRVLETETTRARVVTKDSLAAAGKWYSDFAHYIGKDSKSALAGNSVVQARMATIAGLPDALTVMRDNLTSLVKEIVEGKGAEDLPALEITAEVLPVVEILIAECSELAGAALDVDAL